MTTLNTALTTEWTSLGTGLTTALLQSGGDIRVHIGASAPAVGAAGFFVPSGEPVVFTTVAELGGGMWVRSVASAGGVTYAVA